MLAYISKRLQDYDTNLFVNELAEAAKNLGILEAKISSYHFDGILVPMLHKKEAISSMYIEGTQTTISDVLKNEISPKKGDKKIKLEVENHTRALLLGSSQLRFDRFSHIFIQNIHKTMMMGLVDDDAILGKYKCADNRIVNSAGSVVFTPPSHTETRRYMDDLIDFMNNNADQIHPLIKAAIIHSQFESIHPFTDGNGRVGRLLVSLYLYKSGMINAPFFYISEAISQDKTVYYNMLTESREGNYNSWISYFLTKISIQTQKHIGYIDALNDLYSKTKKTVQESINSPKFDTIMECLFMHPVLNATYLEDKLGVSHGQAVRYLNTLEEKHILHGDDRKRGRMFYFTELIDLAKGF